jgi:hypothetical protein
MSLGPGKYDDLASYCMAQVKADAVVVIVFNGDRGSGMSGKELATEYDIALRPLSRLHKKLPAVLRAVARDIENAPADQFIAGV